MSAKYEKNIEDISSVLSYIIENNKALHSKGGKATTANIEGQAGLGKTSLIEQVAKECGLPHFHKINLQELEDIGDLAGFPNEQFEMKKKDAEGKIVTKWVDKEFSKAYMANKWVPTGKDRTSHRPPAWVPQDGKPMLLLIDDFTRANPRFMQAIMNLVDRQTYNNWSLPKGSTIILTSNPAGGDYLVTEMDPAQKSRYVTLNVKYDANVWAKWAENTGIDGRCINFMLQHQEVIGATDDNGNFTNPTLNARSATDFFEAISGINDFSTKENLKLITMIGQGSVGNEFTQMLVMFIENKLDRLITPAQMYSIEDEKEVLRRIKEVTGEYGESDYRTDLAFVFSSRIINYTLVYSKGNTVTPSFKARLKDLVSSSAFAPQQKTHIIKSIYSGNKDKFKSLAMDPEFAKMVATL